MGWFTAMHEGVCVDCGAPIRVGQPIHKKDGARYRHAVCPPVEPVEERGEG